MIRILLIEDDPWISDMYRDALMTDGGFNILTANNADAALEAIDANHDVALIILDIYLPEHNGIEFLHEVASYDDTVGIPIIVLSSVPAHDFAIAPERWRHYGVAKYLYKPATKPDTLLAEVKKLLVASAAL